MQRGDVVRLTYSGRSVRALVEIASANQKSLALAFDVSLPGPGGGIFPGSMLVLQDEAGVYRALLTGEPVTIEPDTGDASGS
jgi:hypothetical protein